MDRELKERIGRAVGWTQEELVRGSPIWRSPEGDAFLTPFEWSDDADIVAGIESEIERRGLEQDYTAYLMNAVLGVETIYEYGTRQFWAVLRATAEQRAQAFLQAIASTT